MKNKSAASAAITVILSASLSFGAAATRPLLSQAADAPWEQEEAAVKQLKNILSRLVRQDGYLDAALETLSSPGLSAQDISALSVKLKAVKAGLDSAASVNKLRFTEITPRLHLSRYTRAIASYSGKMDKKIARINRLTSALAAKTQKAALRDAVSSTAKSRRRPRDERGKTGGRSVVQLLEDQQAIRRLSADIKNLKGSSARLAATSKWLYIVSK